MLHRDAQVSHKLGVPINSNILRVDAPEAFQHLFGPLNQPSMLLKQNKRVLVPLGIQLPDRLQVLLRVVHPEYRLQQHAVLKPDQLLPSNLPELCLQPSRAATLKQVAPRRNLALRLVLGNQFLKSNSPEIPIECPVQYFNMSPFLQIKFPYCVTSVQRLYGYNRRRFLKCSP